MATKRKAAIEVSAKATKLIARLQAIDTSGDDLSPAFELHREVLSETIEALLAGTITAREVRIINREAGRFVREIRLRTKEVKQVR